MAAAFFMWKKCQNYINTKLEHWQHISSLTILCKLLLFLSSIFCRSPLHSLNIFRNLTNQICSRYVDVKHIKGTRFLQALGHVLKYTKTCESTFLKSLVSFICQSLDFHWLTWRMISLMFWQINSKGKSLMTASCQQVIPLAKSVILHFQGLLLRSA